MFFLVDCDNFFVSCERIFQPALKNRPVVVLSNNDGCVVSRSYEAKALGIPMCSPYFKIENFFTAHNGIALSSNYELYADISSRIMTLLRSEFSSIEIYSIDEAFVRVNDHPRLEQQAIDLRNRILQQIGISVSIGIAATKTLSKIAGDIAKKKTGDKVCLFTDPHLIKERLLQTDVIDIWGVGRRLNARLNFLGIFNAWELHQAPLKMIRKSFNINLEKTVLELNGTPCLEIAEEETQQTLVTSRSFEHDISDFETLRRIISEFTDAACFRLREQNAVARGIVVFLKTNRFDTFHEQANTSYYVALPAPTAHTGKFIRAMEFGLAQIHRPDLSYKSAGVMLCEIQSLSSLQNNLFDDLSSCSKDQKLMDAFDRLNHKLGKKTLYFGTQAAGVRHYIRRDRRSHSYTTSWDDLAVVK